MCPDQASKPNSRLPSWRLQRSRRLCSRARRLYASCACRSTQISPKPAWCCSADLRARRPRRGACGANAARTCTTSVRARCGRRTHLCPQRLLCRRSAVAQRAPSRSSGTKPSRLHGGSWATRGWPVRSRTWATRSSTSARRSRRSCASSQMPPNGDKSGALKYIHTYIPHFPFEKRRSEEEEEEVRK